MHHPPAPGNLGCARNQTLNEVVRPGEVSARRWPTSGSDSTHAAEGSFEANARMTQSLIGVPGCKQSLSEVYGQKAS